MRHIIGLGLAVATAAAVFFGAAWGYVRLLRVPVAKGAVTTLPANGGSLLHDSGVLYAFAALAAVALLVGICVAVPWISPIASGLPGLVLIGVTIWYALNVRQAVRFIPLKGDAFGYGFEAMLFNGILLAAGLAMIVPLFIPSRWRGPLPAADEDEGAASSSLISSDWAETAPITQSSPPDDLWK
jgi:hypothetical protein